MNYMDSSEEEGFALFLLAEEDFVEDRSKDLGEVSELTNRQINKETNIAQIIVM